MGSKDLKDAPSPAASSLLSPRIEMRSRRDSLASISSSRSQLDKNFLSQALDEIHSSASRSESLTTFNEFSPPPTSASSLSDRVGSGGIVQQGLGGLYARLRSSVSTAKDRPAPASLSDSRQNRSTTGNGSVKSPRFEHDSQEDAKTRVVSKLSSATAVDSTSLTSGQESGNQSTNLEHMLNTLESEESQNASVSPKIGDGQDRDKPVMRRILSSPSRRLTEESTSQNASLKSREASKTSKPKTINTKNNEIADREISTLEEISPHDSHLASSDDHIPRFPGIEAVHMMKNNVRPQNKDSHQSLLQSHSRLTNPIHMQNPDPSVVVPDEAWAPSESNPSSASLMQEMRRKVLSKDFWMKDENAKVCFNCGDPFSTFRRKHHCRTCGQIYDARCTVIISAASFGLEGRLRVCKTCENMILGDDSSDELPEDEPLTGILQNRQIRFTNMPTSNGSSSRLHLNIETDSHLGGQPSPNVLSTSSKLNDLRRKPLSYGGEKTPNLTRPTSSWSLRSINNRPQSSNQRLRRPRHQHKRSIETIGSSGSPGQFESSFEKHKDKPLPAFHTDAIIDPDLAPFLSDEDASEEEMSSLNVKLNDDTESFDTTSNGFVGSHRMRSRPLSRGIMESNFSNRDSDVASVTSVRTNYPRRLTGTRSMSVGSVFGKHGPSPRVVRSENLFTDYDSPFSAPLSAKVDRGKLVAPVSFGNTNGSSPLFRQQNTVELGTAGLVHAKKLLRQLLEDSQIDHMERWERVLIPILLRCTEAVDPNMQRGDNIDIRHYIKIKKAAGGSPRDSIYVSGVVFTKNVALKSMPRAIKQPRILIVSFPIVYARHQPHFMSLEPVIAQEKEFLRHLVDRIARLKPNVVFCKNQISGVAIQLLQDANIAVAYNVKESVLHAIARCTQTRIVSSFDKLAMDPNHLGQCESFDLKTFVYKSNKRTFISLSGCQPDLGCTIVLRGENYRNLEKLKRITEFMCSVVYGLLLETCLMRDQFTSLTMAPQQDSVPARSTRSFDPLIEAETSPKQQTSQSGGKSNQITKEDTPYPSEQDKLVASHSETRLEYDEISRELQGRVLSTSPAVKYPEPHLLLKGRQQEQRMTYMRQMLHKNGSKSSVGQKHEHNFELIEPRMIHSDVACPSSKMQNALKIIRTVEFERARQTFLTLKQRWDVYAGGDLSPFNPLSHQQIVVLFSIISTSSSNACEGPDLLTLEFYQEHQIEDDDIEPDVPLGEFVERICQQANRSCVAARCDKKMLDHHHLYVHGEGQISIYTEKCPSRIRGMENTILIWSQCNICNEETPVIPMSARTWKYSFAKYLETSFWSTKMKPRAGLCPHDIHRHHTRYFGFHGLAVRLKYDSINLVDITLPRTKILWQVDKDVTLKKDEFERLEQRLQRYLESVGTRLKSIRIDTVSSGKMDECKTELEKLKVRLNEERSFLISKFQEKYMDSMFYEVIPLNRAVRAMQEKVADWDMTFADFEKNYFPSEKDIRKLAAEQLKNVYLGAGEESHPIDTLANVMNGSSTAPGANTNTGTRNEDSQTTNRELHSPEQRSSSMPTSATQTDSMEKEDFGMCVDGARSFEEQTSKENVNSFIEQNLTQNPLTKHTDAHETEYSNLHEPKQEQCEDTASTSAPLQTEVNAKHDHSHVASEDEDKVTKQESITKRTVGRNEHPKKTKNLLRSQILTTSSDRESATEEPPSLKQKTTGVIAANAREKLSSLPVVSKHNNSSQRDTKSGDRQASTAMKTSKMAMQSMIPRSVNVKKATDSRVSALAKHFEQMSREFEKERLRERLQRAAKMRQSRVLPTASFRPVVEIFKDADEAVKERDLGVTESTNRSDVLSDSSTLQDTSIGDFDEENKSIPSQPQSPQVISQDRIHEIGEIGALVDQDQLSSYAPSLVEENGEQKPSDESRAEISEPSGKAETQNEALEIAKADKSSILKMLTRFWSERSSSGWAPLEYPLLATDHIFADSDVIVREDEPSSLIAFAMASEDYKVKVQKFRERAKELSLDVGDAPERDNKHPADTAVKRALLGKTATHMRYQFQAGASRMQCKIFFAEAFDAIRRKCEVSDRFVESLSRCFKWDSKGGKTKSLFLRTNDQRFVIKSLSTIETQAFLKFAPDYFDYMSKCLFHGLPTALAKIVGFFQVVIKNSSTDTDFNYFLLVLENVFYEGLSNRMFDLKGSMRNRRVQSTGEKDEVLLDENLLDYISQSPVYIRNHSNSFLASSISNDTLFCSKQNVMDYSLIVGLYDDRQELMVGIIDYIRTYTWDKKLESWIKDRGKHKPTVRSPKDYRNRFRRSISRYFPLAPSCWQIFGTQRTDQPPALWEALEFDEDKGMGSLGDAVLNSA